MRKGIAFILSISCLTSFLLGYRLSSSSLNVLEVPYSLVYRLAVVNDTSSFQRVAAWKIRVPAGEETYSLNGIVDAVPVSWASVPGANLPPFSSQSINISYVGTQKYPELPDMLLARMADEDFGSHYEGELFRHDVAGILDMFEWVGDYIERIPYQKQPLTLDQIISQRRGDCSEYTLLSYYALKSSGFDRVIPVVGFYMADGGLRTVDQSNFHAWLLLYDQGSWKVVDPLYKTIEDPSDRYVVVDIMTEGHNSDFIEAQYSKIYLGRNI